MIKMKKVLKITIILIIIITTIFQINCVYAIDTTTGNIDSNFYKPGTIDPGTGNAIKDKANIIVTIIRNVGIIVSVIALMLIGFKEMTASIEEKSVIKQALPGYLIGIVLVEAVTLLPTIIYNVASKW